MQEMQVRSLGREGPTCHGTIKPVCHNYWACALEPASHNCRRPLPRARALEQERPLPWEVWAPQWESSLHSPRLEKKPCGGKDPAQPKINLKIKKKKIEKQKNMELKIQNGESLDKRNTTDAKVLWGVLNADGYLEMKRWLSTEGHKSTVCVLTQEGEGSQRHGLKQVTGRTAPSWKRAQKNGAQSPGKRQGSLLFFWCSGGKGPSEKF